MVWTINHISEKNKNLMEQTCCCTAQTVFCQKKPSTDDCYSCRGGSNICTLLICTQCTREKAFVPDVVEQTSEHYCFAHNGHVRNLLSAQCKLDTNKSYPRNARAQVRCCRGKKEKIETMTLTVVTDVVDQTTKQ